MDQMCWAVRQTAGVLALGLALALGGCVTATMHREKGNELRRQGDLVTALEEFEQSVAKDPTSYRAQYWLGRTYNDLGRPLDAQLPLEKALELRRFGGSETERILDELARSYFEQGAFEELFAFLEAEAEGRGRPVDYIRLADFMVKAGDVDQAAVAYQKAAFFAEPDDEWPYLELAGFYESVNDRPKAVLALRNALFIAPESEEVAARLRSHGLVPGPTLKLRPAKPLLKSPEGTPPPGRIAPRAGAATQPG
ncbi:MAG: tetratricopeptide repeat protein [Planctomycetota bacterium]